MNPIQSLTELFKDIAIVALLIICLILQFEISILKDTIGIQMEINANVREQISILQGKKK